MRDVGCQTKGNDPWRNELHPSVLRQQCESGEESASEKGLQSVAQESAAGDAARSRDAKIMKQARAQLQQLKMEQEVMATHLAQYDSEAASEQSRMVSQQLECLRQQCAWLERQACRTEEASQQEMGRPHDRPLPTTEQAVTQETLRSRAQQLDVERQLLQVQIKEHRRRAMPWGAMETRAMADEKPNAVAPSPSEVGARSNRPNW